MELEIGENVPFLTFPRLSMIHGKAGQDFKHSENLGQRTIKDIEDKREAKVSSLGDWTLSNSTERNRRGGEEMGCPWSFSDMINLR